MTNEKRTNEKRTSEVNSCNPIGACADHRQGRECAACVAVRNRPNEAKLESHLPTRVSDLEGTLHTIRRMVSGRDARDVDIREVIEAALRLGTTPYQCASCRGERDLDNPSPTDEQRARQHYLGGAHEGHCRALVALMQEVRAAERRDADTRASGEVARLRFALLNDPSDGTCRLCGSAPTDENKLCENCFEELRDQRSANTTSAETNRDRNDPQEAAKAYTRRPNGVTCHHVTLDWRTMRCAHCGANPDACEYENAGIVCRKPVLGTLRVCYDHAVYSADGQPMNPVIMRAARDPREPNDACVKYRDEHSHCARGTYGCGTDHSLWLAWKSANAIVATMDLADVREPEVEMQSFLLAFQSNNEESMAKHAVNYAMGMASRSRVELERLAEKRSDQDIPAELLTYPKPNRDPKRALKALDKVNGLAKVLRGSLSVMDLEKRLADIYEITHHACAVPADWVEPAESRTDYPSTDGHYRVVTGASGERTLYLFPPGPSGAEPARSITIDEEDVTVQTLVKKGIQFEPWSPGAFVALLDDLEQYNEPGGNRSNAATTAKVEP